MRQRLAAALLVTLLVSSGVAVADDVESTDTVVVAVGDSSAQLAANAIANRHGYTVVHSSVDGLSVQAQQTLHELDVDRAVVVGDDIRVTTNDLQSMDIDVVDQVSADTDGALFYRATLQQWSSASAAFVTSNDTTDRRKVAVALDGSPVLDERVGTPDITETLSYLGVSKVYVTPGVSTETRNALSDDYTVTTTVGSTDLEKSLSGVSRDLASDGDDIVVTDKEHVMDIAEIGVRANGSVVVGPSAQEYPSSRVYVVGYDSSDLEIATEREFTAPDLGLTVWNTAYSGPVLVSYAERTGDDAYDIDIRNIGTQPVATTDAYSVRASWSGTIEGSNPNGTQDGDSYVVTWNESVETGDTLSVVLTVNRVSNQGHPNLRYHGTTTGSIIGLDPAGIELDLPFVSLTPSVWVIAAFFVGIGVLVLTAFRGFRNNR